MQPTQSPRALTRYNSEVARDPHPLLPVAEAALADALVARVDEVFAAHADAAARLARALPDPNVTLVPLTYTELWDHWKKHGDDALRRHVRCLRERYAVELHP